MSTFTASPQTAYSCPTTGAKTSGATQPKEAPYLKHDTVVLGPVRKPILVDQPQTPWSKLLKHALAASRKKAFSLRTAVTPFPNAGAGTCTMYPALALP